MSTPAPDLELNEHTICEALFAYADIPEELKGGAFIKQLRALKGSDAKYKDLAYVSAANKETNV